MTLTPSPETLFASWPLHALHGSIRSQGFPSGDSIALDAKLLTLTGQCISAGSSPRTNSKSTYDSVEIFATANINASDLLASLKILCSFNSIVKYFYAKGQGLAYLAGLPCTYHLKVSPTAYAISGKCISSFVFGTDIN